MLRRTHILGLLLLFAGTRAYAVVELDAGLDLAALAAQSESIEMLSSSLDRFKGTPREAILLFQIAEAQQKSSSIEYRLAYGKLAKKKEGAVDLSRYKKRISEVIRVTSILLEKYPQNEVAESAYFMRAQAYDELKFERLAEKDYRYVADHYPSSTNVTRAIMALADFAMEAGDHQRAITHLKRIESQPTDARYPFALYKMAWSYYNLNDFSMAITYLSRHVAYYNKKQSADPTIFPASEEALRERSALDCPLFFSAGLANKKPGFELSEAVPTFRKIGMPALIGKMYLRLAKMLRIRDEEEALIRWKDTVMGDKQSGAETLDVLMVTFEYLFNKRELEKLLSVARDFKRLDQSTSQQMRKYESYEPAQTLILSATTQLQRRLAASKEETEFARLGKVVSGIYEAFIDISDENNANAIQAHYNLAETLFKIKEFEASARQYTWVIDHWTDKLQISRAQLRLKRISSQYQSLLGENLIPKTLTPTVLQGEETLNANALDPHLREWVRLVEGYRNDEGAKDLSAGDFEFDANRACYAQGQTRAVTKRLMRMIKDRPRAKYSVPSASLILDTYVVSQDWEGVVEISDRLLHIQGLGDETFARNLRTAGADALYKTVEAAYQKKDFKQTLSLAQKFLKKYPTSPRSPECLLLANRASTELNDREKSAYYLDVLLSQFPDAMNRGQALLLRAKLSEEEYEFEKAMIDYEAYLVAVSTQENTEAKRLSIQKRLFLLKWLAKNPLPLECPEVKDQEALMTECRRYQALISLRVGTSEKSATERALRGPVSNQTLWAAVALQSDSNARFSDRLSLMRTLALGWNDLEPLVKASTIPVIVRALPDAFAQSRREFKSMGRLKATKAAISRRIDLIRELESTAETIIKLPWARVHVSVLAELAEAYLLFAKEIRGLPMPRGMAPKEVEAYQKTIEGIVTPLDEKGTRLRKQAIELAMELAVDPQGIAGLDPVPREVAAQRVPMDFALLQRMEREFPEVSSARLNAVGKTLKTRWTEAVEARAWGRAAFFLRELEEKAKPRAEALSLMRAIALNLAGAEAEALSEIESMLPGWNSEAQNTLNHVLYSYYSRSPESKKAKKVQAEIDRFDAQKKEIELQKEAKK